MGKILLVLLSVAYLFAEFVFNANLTHLLANNTIQNYKDIEYFGRSISAIGACLLFFRFVFNLEKTFFKKFLLNLVFLPFIFVGTYKAQEELLNIISSETPKAIKMEQAKVYLIQKGLSTETLAFDLNNLTSNQYAAFVASLGLLGFNNIIDPYYDLATKKTNVIFYNDFKENEDFYYNGFKKIKRLPDLAYSDYMTIGNNINSKYRLETQQSKLNNYWRKVKYGKHRILNDYRRIKRDYKELVADDKKDILPNIIKEFKNYMNCSNNSYSCKSNAKSKIIYFQESYKFKHKEINPFDLCKKSKTNKLRIKSYYYGEKVYNLKNTDQNHYCNVDLRPFEKAINAYYAKDYEKTYGVDRFTANPNNQKEMNYVVKRAIKNKIKNDYGIEISTNFNLNSKTSFQNELKKGIKKKITDNAKNSFKASQGFTVPFHLNNHQFFMNKEVNKRMKEKLSIYYHDRYSSYLGKKGFIKKYEKNFKTTIGKHYSYNIKNNEEFIDHIFRMTIIPIIAITFSLVFGLLNLVFLSRDIFCSLFRIKKKIVRVSFTTILLLLIIFIPFYLFNPFSNNIYFLTIFNELKNTHILLAYFYQWFLHTETIILDIFNHKEFLIPFDKNGSFI